MSIFQKSAQPLRAASGLTASLVLGRRFMAALLFFVAGLVHASGAEVLWSTTLTAPDGKPMVLDVHKGKPLIVNFWARWCGPCRTEIPELQKAHDKYKKQGLVVLGIGLENSPEAVRDFMKAYEMNYPVGLANMVTDTKGIWLMQTLGNPRAGLPFTLWINRKGEIVGYKLGVMKPEDIEAAVQAVLR
jgi:thiol-disulfide isomerase/thioredoxin